MGIGLALQKQLCNATLQRIDLRSLGGVGVARYRRQLPDIAFDPLGKLDLDLGSGFAAHDLAGVDTELSQRFGTVLSTLGCATSDSLGSKSLDFVVRLPVLHRRDLIPHLPHLRFEIAQHLEELPGFRPWKEGHETRILATSAVIGSLIAILQAMCLLTS
jgi:hypothetical protein